MRARHSIDAVDGRAEIVLVCILGFVWIDVEEDLLKSKAEKKNSSEIEIERM